MNKEEKDGIIRDAVRTYGAENQLFQTTEELAELQQAISKAKRYTGQAYIDGVTEEIADVLIMIEQVKLIFGISAADVEKERERKLKRLKNLMKGK